MSDHWEMFRRAHAGGLLHSSWLLVGARGCGKMKFVEKAAGLLIGDATFTLAAPHGSVLQVGSKGETIGIEELRSARQFAMLASENNRIIALKNLDAVSTEGCNILLKTLEEAPSKLFFFLLSNEDRRVLPTIRSRCCRLHFRRKPGEEGAITPSFDEPIKREALGFLSGNLPVTAEALLGEDPEGEKLRQIYMALQGLPKASPEQILAVINCLKRGDTPMLWEAWRRGMLVWLAGFIEERASAAFPLGFEVWEKLETLFKSSRIGLDPRQMVLAAFHHCRQLVAIPQRPA